MSWTQQKVQSSNILFEICNSLFNYAVLNFNQAAMYLKEKKGMAEFKGALEKLRYAKWAIRELIDYHPELQKVVKIPTEFKASSLEFLLGLFEGLSYLCFLEMFSANPNVTQENLASLEREIAKWFYLCRDNLRNNKDLKKIMKHVYPDVLSYYYTHNYNALDRTIKLLAQKHIAEKTKGYIGIQLAYILEA